MAFIILLYGKWVAQVYSSICLHNQTLIIQSVVLCSSHDCVCLGAAGVCMCMWAYLGLGGGDKRVASLQTSGEGRKGEKLQWLFLCCLFLKVLKWQFQGLWQCLAARAIDEPIRIGMVMQQFSYFHCAFRKYPGDISETQVDSFCYVYVYHSWKKDVFSLLYASHSC